MISAPKGISVLRDDVRKLLAELITLHKDKLGLINKILLNEADLRHHISAGNTEQMHEIIERDREIISSVDIKDFHIAETIRVLSGITETSTGDFEDFLRNNGSGPPAELAGIRKKVHEALSLLRDERIESLDRMKNLSESIGSDMADLAVMFRMDIKT